jgi:diguanylate cyclase (GGDEF)-like protein/PAS domain S-box-containing protein
MNLPLPPEPLDPGPELISRLRAAYAKVHGMLPQGRTLPDEEWDSRHRAMLWLLWGHVVALAVFLFCQGFGVWGSIAPVLPIALAGVVGTLGDVGRRARSVAVVFGLLTASAVLVYGWHGQIEAHFHFFVMIAVLALYEDWLPFGLAFAYVGLEHGVLGVLAPHDVYSHGGDPWAWAAVHGGFVLAAGAAAVVTWRLNENTRARMVRADQSARQTGERFRVAFDSGIFGMSMMEPGGRFLRVNRALCELLGYTEQELLRRTFADVIYPEDVDRMMSELQALLDGAVEVHETEERYRHRDGSVVWVQLGIKPVRDEQDRVEYFLCQISDITARKRFEQELAHWALHDALTGLPNRRLFSDRVAHHVARLKRHPRPLAVLFVDLDRFKLVNDTMGHAIGDAVLVDAAGRLTEAVRTEDTVARFGGDEFTIVCEDADEDEARRVAHRVLGALSQPFEHKGRQFQLGASIGIRVTRNADAAADALLQDADIALYAAKQKGRGRLELFDAEARAQALDLLATEQGLRLALIAGQLRVHYQPEVSLSTGQIVAMEALVRWEHPERGLVPPAEFIPVAEQSGLITAVGEWVLHEACAQLVAWRSAGTVTDAVRVAVNVSARQLSDPSLSETVGIALTATGLDPAALCLEITENALFQNPEVALANLAAVKQLGVAIALDDFGVGFSSLSRIRDLPPVDIIKIDRSFIIGLGQTAADDAVIAAVISLGAHLEMTVVAEGIEHHAQLQALQELGCDVGQGFLFARPQPPEQLAEVLTSDMAALTHTRPLVDEPAGV